jgi:hypothetical protein
MHANSVWSTWDVYCKPGKLEAGQKVTDEDFERAINGSSKAAHNPAQYLHVSARTESQAPPTAHKKSPLLPVSALSCETMPRAGMPPQGLEP